jgi:hypothetical protein
MKFSVDPLTNVLLCEASKSHILYCKQLQDFKAINHENYNIATLKREPMYDVSNLLTQLTNDSTLHFQETAGKEKLIRNLMNYITSLSIKPNDELAYLIEDIEQLITIFSKVSKSKKVNLLLSVVNTNMCELFHTDINELRLLCTYKGKGTLWADNSNVNWNEMNCCKTNEALIKDQTKIHKAKPFEVLVLKGALHESNNSHAILHRSPTVEESKENRLLLRLDTQNFGKF